MIEHDRPRRWVVQKRGKYDRRLGRIVHQDARSISVDFGNGETVTWDRFPHGVSEVTEGTVQWRAVAEPEALRAQFDSDPTSLVLGLLRESGATLTAPDVRWRLEQLGLLPARPGGKGSVDPAKEQWSTAWSAARKALVSHEHVVAEGRPLSYRWSDEPIEPHRRAKVDRPTGLSPEVSRALEKMAASPGRGHERERSIVQRAAQSGELPPAMEATAVALGALPDKHVEWSSLPLPNGVPLAAADILLQRAADDGAWKYLTAVIVHLRSLPTATRSGQLLSDGPAAIVGDAIADEVRSWEQRLAGPEADVAWVRSRLSQFASAFPNALPGSALDAVLRITALVARAQRNIPARDDALEQSLGMITRAGPHTLSEAMTRVWTTRDGAVILRAAGALSFSADQPRAQLLEAMVIADSNLIPLGDEAIWRGLGPVTAPALATLPNLGRFLCSTEHGVGRSVVGPRAAAWVRSSDLIGLFAMLDWPDRLRRLLPVDEWAARFIELSKKHPGGMLLDAVFDRAAASARSLAAEATSHIAEQHAREMALVVARAEMAERSASELAARASALEDRLRSGSRAQVSAHESQLRQARLEGLRLVADMIEETRRLASGNDRLARLVERQEILAARLGLIPLDAAGAVVPYDQSRHRGISDAPDRAGSVRVLEPPWGVVDGGTTVVVRHGQVQRYS